MTRRIKFRGKDRNTGKWVYGDLLSPITGCRIVSYREVDNGSMKRADYLYHDVLDDTVGQFTGLHDRNGKEIYEGDIVRNGNNTYCVEYDTAHACWIAAYDWPDSVGNWQLSKEHCLRNEVVGNIHEQSKS